MEVLKRPKFLQSETTVVTAHRFARGHFPKMLAPVRFTVSDRTEKRIGTRQCLASTNQMALYFFHILNPDCELIFDEEGGEFDNFETAKQEAIDSLRDLAVDALKQGRHAHGLAIQIMDADGTVIDTLYARETFA